MADTPLAKYLRMLRKKNKLTQKELADKLGITRGNYSHFETSFSMPSNDILDQLSYIYDVPLINFIKLSAISGKDSERRIKEATSTSRPGINGLFYDNPSSPSPDPLYIEFINNFPEMSGRDLKKWLSPEDLEIVYNFHKLNPRDKHVVNNIIKLLLIDKED